MLEHRSLLAPLVESLRFCVQGDHARSIEVAMRAIGSGTPDPEVRFYLARHLAHEGAEQPALDSINNLAGEGFFCSTALRNDPWLKPLSQLPRYEEVLDAVLRREAEARASFDAADGNRILPKAGSGN